MLNAARRVAARGDWRALAGKVANAPDEKHPSRREFEAEIQALMRALSDARDFHAGEAVQRAHAKIRERIAFMPRDRAMDGDVRAITRMIAERVL
jgi:histidine ammonia-lyase